MARTTPEEVAEILEIDSSISLDPFITTANELVTEYCVDSGYTDARLELIERWLAAHFYCIRDPRSASESAGVSVSYQSPSLGMHLQGTVYGQQALLLDTEGKLAALSKRTEAGRSKSGVGVTWLGTESTDTEDEEE